MPDSTQKIAREQKTFEGILTFENFLIDSPRAAEIDRMLGYHAQGARMHPNLYRSLVDELRGLCSVRRMVTHNMVVKAARSAIAGRLVGETAYTGTINYGALGSGATAVADTDTVLDTEVARVIYATYARTDDVATVDFYYNKASTNGTYQEFGTFIDATATVDTGLMFNRALTGGWTKSSSEAMTVSLQITVSHA